MFNPHLKRRPFSMSPISIHLHRRYQSGARISMLTPPFGEVNMVTQTNEQFWTILLSSIRRLLGDQRFSKHLQVCQNTCEQGNREKSRKVGRVWFTYNSVLDLKPLSCSYVIKKMMFQGPSRSQFGQNPLQSAKKPSCSHIFTTLSKVPLQRSTCPMIAVIGGSSHEFKPHQLD